MQGGVKNTKDVESWNCIRCTLRHLLKCTQHVSRDEDWLNKYVAVSKCCQIWAKDDTLHLKLVIRMQNRLICNTWQPCATSEKKLKYDDSPKNMTITTLTWPGVNSLRKPAKTRGNCSPRLSLDPWKKNSSQKKDFGFIWICQPNLTLKCENSQSLH